VTFEKLLNIYEVFMLNIGESPIDFIRRQVDTGNNVSLPTYTGKTVLLSFIDYNNGWGWLKNLLNIHASIVSAGKEASVQIIAVVYWYQSAACSDDITDKMAADTDFPETMPFPVLVDSAWVNSTALQYFYGFSCAYDSLFHGQCGASLCSYIISSDYKVTDKWHPYITTVGDPISFTRLTNVGTFDSANLSASEAFIVQRLVNLCAAPKILYGNPVSGSTVNSVSTVKLIYSKLLGSGAASAGNYALGGMVTGLSISDASFSGADRVENVITLSLGGTPTSGSLTATVGSSVTDTAGNAFQSGYNSVSYTIP
jgi:hypothetical protein